MDKMKKMSKEITKIFHEHHKKTMKPKTYRVEFTKEEVFELCQILKDYDGQEKCLDKDLNSAIKKLTTIEE